MQNVTVAMSVSTTVAADWLAASDVPQECMARSRLYTFRFYFLYRGMWTMCSPQLHN